jgi:CRP-like cAMP-binding protein
MNRVRTAPQSNYPPPSIMATPFAHASSKGAVQLLNDDERNALLEISRIVEVRRSGILWAEGAPAHFVYNLVSGVSETYHLLPTGERRVLAFVFPCDLLGLAEGGQYAATAQAVTDVVAYKIPWESLEQLVRRDPQLDVALLCKLCDELRQSERHLLSATENDATARVAGFVLSFWRSKVPDLVDETSVTLPMLRHDIADYLGLTPESVSRALLRLEKSHLLQRVGSRRLKLLNILGLQRAARQA